MTAQKTMTEAKIFRREDYQPYPFTIDSVDLDLVLDPESTVVTNTMLVTPKAGTIQSNLVLDADEIAFERLFVNGEELDDSRYELTANNLIIRGINTQSRITVVNRCSPARNTALSGIYMSNGAFMSQCESEGFRRITYWPDHPDVMSCFTVTIHAKKSDYPILLSNGNLEARGDEDADRHWARYRDPFKKPSYLFALVAGKFVDRSERFMLKDGRECVLSIWTEAKNYEKSGHALESLKKAIRWDEDRFGLELDLDRFGIVATDDFNFGAMENKGLNIFNSRYVMAAPKLATDTDYDRIESVVGHEYFHNWTGNRVTVRDWFQITLKEGLTTFRDQEFSMDMAPDVTTRAVKRINDVRALRTIQFPEDSGPMAHPIRPESYQAIDNFYTMTVYEKGAEVIRMLQTILGREGFNQGLRHYIARFDGQAVTCDDFLEAMGEANNVNLSRFSRWYSQAGTPRVVIETRYDPIKRTYTLRASQSTPPTAGQSIKHPVVIPITVGLIDRQGTDIPLTLEGELTPGPTSRVLQLSEDSQEWVFVNLPENPVPSIGRDFSAPVIFDYNYTREELVFLALHDSDPFNRAEAMQRLMLDSLGEMIQEAETGCDIIINEGWLRTFGEILLDETLSPMFRATILTIPDERTIAQHRAMINPDTIHIARAAAREQIGNRYSQELGALVKKLAPTAAYVPTAVEAGKRALRNLALDFWLVGGSAKALLATRDQFEKSDNLTDKLAALTIIVNSQSPAKIDVLNSAARDWYLEPLLLNKWFTVQATTETFEDEMPVVERVKALMNYEVFSKKNPNNCYALLGAFFNNNPYEFHRIDGSGYDFWVQCVLELDPINSHVASRMARALDQWRQFEPTRARLMYKALQQVASTPTLSRGVREIVEKALFNH